MIIPTFETWIEAFKFGLSTVVAGYPIIETFSNFIKNMFFNDTNEGVKNREYVFEDGKYW